MLILSPKTNKVAEKRKYFIHVVYKQISPEN